jgi:hypothetical protein
LNISEWLEYGIEKGFCSTTACATHDGVEGTDEENAEWEDGGDPCQHIVRLWEQ